MTSQTALRGFRCPLDPALGRRRRRRAGTHGYARQTTLEAGMVHTQHSSGGHGDKEGEAVRFEMGAEEKLRDVMFASPVACLRTRPQVSVCPSAASTARLSDRVPFTRSHIESI